MNAINANLSMIFLKKIFEKSRKKIANKME